MNHKFTFLIFALSISFIISSCGNDDGRSCTTCNSDQTPDFTVCQESNGNASVNGQDTGTNYDTYISGLVEAGATCGG
ncbi:hypothetical protein BXY75_0455 [Ulvibacter antarcticus]|uniref:Uncharacterized protein n=2 Tax=Ulvibacter antarcticus TaxID=442714 RepID=A0A3L9Z6K5_9FLAO|nr:hypothetical protein BXY75_0455 [Ulvibacter antarcticus]